MLVGLECGYANVSDPLVETALVAAPLLAHDPDALEPLAAGALSVALSHPINPWIADLDTADRVLGPAPQGEARRLEGVDPLRRLFAGAASGEPGDARMLDLAALITAAQLLGGAERMLKLAADYAVAREQFGQPIGAFRPSSTSSPTSRSRSSSPARSCSARPTPPITATPARPSRSATPSSPPPTPRPWPLRPRSRCTGPMGYTYEVDLHYWMKRAWALAGAWGDRAFHERRLADAVIGGRMALDPTRPSKASSPVPEAYIIDAIRTPVGKKKGALSAWHAADLARCRSRPWSSAPASIRGRWTM